MAYPKDQKPFEIKSLTKKKKITMIQSAKQGIHYGPIITEEIAELRFHADLAGVKVHDR